jgi:hypothetical protein
MRLDSLESHSKKLSNIVRKNCSIAYKLNQSIEKVVLGNKHLIKTDDFLGVWSEFKNATPNLEKKQKKKYFSSQTKM